MTNKTTQKGKKDRQGKTLKIKHKDMTFFFSLKTKQETQRRHRH